MYEMRLTSIFSFGKHKGDQVEDVIYDDPSYMTYLFNEGFKFDSDVVRLLEELKLI